ncbi:HD-GYP domain-containing protein [Ramlibacter sp. H39-3-26]|uniref:HD-GYP domain-containing protein n=1 Tax=Curvibacter soli TaxID=3031331 RepID=UPI0023DC33F9|nr:HD-GYP domain-containing protein [Ramlibacter sp. H39-3-26]MDF1485429.1 HD-GYP domain-containing protein [Ramlibacter sp. H39-3-26]
MLKKVPISQVRLGMHVHRIEGPWIDHPFWRSAFTLSDPKDLAALRQSQVTELWIDVQKGLDVLQAPASAAARAAPAADRALHGAAQAPASRAGPPIPLQEELQHARRIMAEGRAAVISMFQEARLDRAVRAMDAMPLVDEIAHSVERNPQALVSIARLKTRDDYTYMHSVAVCALMTALARQFQFGDEQVRLAGLAGLMHDIGKARMPLDVLNKPGKLTAEEFSIMQGHPEAGWAILRANDDTPEAVLDTVLHHHEKFEGGGYPHGLRGDGIALLARMGAVCDVYDAITSNRPYKAGWDPAVSIRQMNTWRGHFDPRVLQAFIKSIGIYPIGSLVRLESQKLGVVTGQGSGTLLAPVVTVFYSTRSSEPIARMAIDLSAPGCRERIAGLEDAQKWGFRHLDDMWAA